LRCAASDLHNAQEKSIHREDNVKQTASTTLVRTLSTVALVAVLLAGCGTPQAQSNPAPVADGVNELNQPQEALDQGLDQSGRLALGTLELEATTHAVTSSQASALLPLWQAIRSGTLQSVEETDAVLAQIEGVRATTSWRRSRPCS
jgi:hypothetical protein